MANVDPAFVHLTKSECASDSTRNWSHAFHEAGHVVAAYQLGANVLEAALLPDEDSGEPSGYTKFTFPELESEKAEPKIVKAARPWEPLGAGSSAEVKDWVVRHAGGVAQLLLAALTGGSIDEDELHHDTRQDRAMWEPQLYGLTTDEKATWTATRYIETWALLLASQWQLEHVAQLLLRHDGHAVDGGVLVQAMNRQPPGGHLWTLADSVVLNLNYAREIAVQLGHPTWPTESNSYWEAQIAEAEEITRELP
ncbi:hypothetical protein [Nakamurella endophytica]|uniref:Peptidase M41 domain-containing protein n=1 Tax=Nakamurella endophytica TaxID=1748367 RepID=A0A917TBB1_9ACTN|nr:hypothetical protein [Nakamurella endophytica]GGM14316.1 hypothetical protein GCM10011594_37930 [Nakamurella endophytica]